MLGGRDASRLSAASAKAQKRIFPSPPPFCAKCSIFLLPPFPSQNFLLVNSPPLLQARKSKSTHTHSLAPSIFHTLHGSIHPPSTAFLPLPCDTLFVIQTFLLCPFSVLAWNPPPVPKRQICSGHPNFLKGGGPRRPIFT